MARAKKISNDNELDNLIKFIPDNRQKVAKDLVIELKFMNKTLKRLRDVVDNGEILEEFNQGKQSFIRENSALKSYNTTIQRYSLLYKQLIDLIDKTPVLNDDNELVNFISGN
ncbi:MULTISPECIES: hypothetical protein [unclassified Campylobacter]|uniref:hypothetical protein n=1 Tax=unclassified Campylobacter TaxID=2593542 RepID=UPI001472B8A6|nr:MULTISPECIES: hypothetical protein [unclassified Campylobacter]